MRSKLLLSLLLCNITIFAQENIRYVFQHEHGRVHDIAFNNDQLIAGGSEKSCRQPILSLFNPDGILQWTTQTYECGYCKVDDVAFASNGDLLTGGDWRVADDYPTIEDGIAVARFDIMGNQLAYQKMANYPTYNPVCILELPDGRILAGAENHLFGFSAQLDSLFTLEFPIGGNEYFLEMAILDDTTLVLLTPNQLFFTDWEGQIFEQMPRPGSTSLKDMAVRGDSLLFMNSAKLYFLNLANDSLTSLSLPQLGRSGLILDAGKIFVWGSAVYQLDETGEWDKIYQPWLDQNNSKAIIHRNGAFYRGGEDILEPPLPNGYEAFRVGYVERFVTVDSVALPPREDIGVTHVEMLELISQDVYEEFPDVYLVTFNFRFGVTVTNFGDFEVSSFLVASEKLGNFNCEEGRFFALVDSAALQAGESMVIEGEMTQSYYSEGNTNPTVSLERCFFTGAPNHNFDHDYTNNHFCGLVLVGTEETEKPLSLRLYPNPATDLLYVELDADIQIEAYSWINAAGQVVGQASVAPTSKLELQRPGPAGMYWLRVVSRDGVGYQAVVWR